VSETDEEDSVSSGEQKQRHKPSKMVISLGHFSQLINKRIFSDDFDKGSSELSQGKKNKKFGAALSMVDQPIKEDSEYLEGVDDKYMSDSSSNSQFSLRRRHSVLEKLIDKLDHPDSDSFFSVFGSKFNVNVNDTIEEELSAPSDELEQSNSKSLSNNSSKYKYRSMLNPDPINPLTIQFFREKIYRASKSMIASQE
jgi:hypothetical protein